MGKRRTKAEIDAIREAIYAALLEDRPMTVRQVFYRLVSNGVIGKTENEYKNTVCRLLVEMRRAGTVPYGWIADNTRWMRRPRTYGSMKAALRITAEAYRRSLWATAPATVEVWLEKDALAGVLYEVTEAWDVPLMVTRGYPSLSYLHEAAEALRDSGKPAFLYYFGDYDPSGLDIPRFVQGGLREMVPEAEIIFERVAVNPEQIEALGLVTRPTKRTDSRSKGFEGGSVEVDAIPPRTLKALVHRCVERHLDPHALATLRNVEEQERATLRTIAASLALN